MADREVPDLLAALQKSMDAAKAARESVVPHCCPTHRAEGWRCPAPCGQQCCFDAATAAIRGEGEPARCGSAEPHGPHSMPCDSGCQPDWHRDSCAIYGKCPGIAIRGEGDRA